MKINFINQIAGQDAIGDLLNNLLKDETKGFLRLKLVMAFVNHTGLSQIQDSLESFYDRRGILEFIIGLDNGITSYEALKYLRTRFPKAGLFLFQDQSVNVVFHPKIVILEGQQTTVCIVGSANVTVGGLYNNFETGVVFEINHEADQEYVDAVSSLWTTFRNPMPPLSAGHILELSEQWLEQNRRNFPTKKEVKRERKRRLKWKFSGFAAVKRKSPKQKPLRTGTAKPAAHAPEAGSQLYLEILSETRDGNQVQIPTIVVESFFKGDLTTTKELRLSVNGATFRDVTINHFPNNTHRISINELTGVSRPAIAVFTRQARQPDSYNCEVLEGEAYKAALLHCTEQTREGSRRWGIE